MSNRLTDNRVDQFLDALASSAPAPGGGSVAALSGALGAALVSMVCNLTVGKTKYAHVQDDIAALLAQSEALRHKLTDLLEADVQAFTGVSTAYKMPRSTDEEKLARSDAIQQALKAATVVPMDVAEACIQVLDLCMPVAEKGNVNAVSDAGVAALMAEAALRSAALNVIININAIKDESFSGQMRERLNSLLAGKPELKDQIYDVVVEKL
ncbi:MAG: cyclodeaminase/cyclohydrolase family protein [Chloroflexi bacterium]|nr:cyclodeaminase/cyclohydrolase family protein [Chloroflexota bacterium]MBL7198950.1 cyclodeaminase/cyclohydrolase family protein [Anaerolineae bacterium]